LRGIRGGGMDFRCRATKRSSIDRSPDLTDPFDTIDRFRDSNQHCICILDALYSAQNFKGLDQRHEMPAM